MYEYDPITEQQKIVIKTNGAIFSSGVVLNNKLYVGSWDHNVYEYDPVTNQQKVVITTNYKIWSSGVVLNNKLYFATNSKVYEYDPITEQQKVVIITNGAIFSSGVVFNNKLYFGSGSGKVYEYDPVTNQQKVVITTNEAFNSSGLVFNNKLYFGSLDHNVYEYDPVTNQQKVVITTNERVFSSGIIFNNKIYFGSWDHNVYEYDPTTEQQKIVITTNGEILSSGAILNDKIYFSSWDHNVYEYDQFKNFEKINLVLNLEKINNNADETILNNFNYKNFQLNINDFKILNKNYKSALISIKKNSNMYKSLNLIKVKYQIKNKDEINNIDLNDLLKKIIYFNFIDKNFYSFDEIKEIKNINIDNLNFNNVEVTKNNDLKWSVNFKDVCFDIKERTNTSSIIKSLIIPKCDYNQKSNFIFQIITGINKDEKDNTKNGWTLNMADENKLNDFININYRNQIITHTLSNDFNFANLKQQKKEMEFVFNEPEEEITINPNEKATIAYSVRESKYEVMLNLTQKITGSITAKIIDYNNEEQIFTLSIKEAMQILQKYSLLPDEIIINEDDNITFNGKAIISRILESKPKLILNTSII